jgi:hypothetical protein
MLNFDLKRNAIAKLRESQSTYLEHFETVKQRSERLFTLRNHQSQVVLGDVESYVNTLANSPKEFDRSVQDYKVEFRSFSKILHDLAQKAADIDFEAGTVAAAGVIAGAGTATLGGSAAIAIAMTFGTASTGTAISALSGAAAVNAALAWLGGGALVAGGGGMAAGSFLVALTGPIGWALGGIAVVGSGIFAHVKNHWIAEEAIETLKVIETHNAALTAATRERGRLIEATEQHLAGVGTLTAKLRAEAPRDYASFTPEQKDRLGALINHIHSLSALINKKVDA